MKFPAYGAQIMAYLVRALLRRLADELVLIGYGRDSSQPGNGSSDRSMGAADRCEFTTICRTA